MKKLLTLVLLTLGLAVGASAVDVTPTYKIAAYVDVATAKAKLTEAGFEVVGTYAPFEKGTTVLFTSAALKAAATKPGRGFAAVGRLLVDDERQQVHIANPVYFGKAFLQDDYNEATATAALASLEKSFGPSKDSDDGMEFSKLAGFHFMIGMPYYEDMGTVGKGATADLVARAKAAKGTAGVVQLGADSYLAFVELDSRTSSFVKKIGTEKSELLPWAVLIENGEAKALKAEYYIALSYPLLDLGGFANIMTAPAAVIKSLEKTFK